MTTVVGWCVHLGGQEQNRSGSGALGQAGTTGPGPLI